MKRIIVPLDGSTRAERALAVAEALGEKLDAGVELVRVVSRAAVESGTPPDATVRAALTDVAQEMMTGCDVSVSAPTGDPVEEILKLAAGAGKVLIVMATHGRRGFDRALHGSVADELMRRSPIPVVIVRDEPHGNYQVNRLLVPVDGSHLSEDALSAACAVAAHRDTVIHLVRVVEPVWLAAATGLGPQAAYMTEGQAMEYERRVILETRSYLDELAARLRDQGFSVTWEIRQGLPAEEIARAAETTGASMIVISSHGRGGVRRWAFGSVTTEVLRLSSTPVLVVPPAATNKPEPGAGGDAVAAG